MSAEASKIGQAPLASDAGGITEISRRSSESASEHPRLRKTEDAPWKGARRMRPVCFLSGGELSRAARIFDPCRGRSPGRPATGGSRSFLARPPANVFHASGILALARCCVWFALVFSAATLVVGQDAAPNPLTVLVQTLGRIESPEAQANILRGMNASLKGRRGVVAPPAWAELYEKLRTSPSEDVRQQAQALAATFGGGGAIEEMRKTLGDPAATVDARKAALDSLLAAKDAATLPLLLSFVKQPGSLRALALRGLAGYDDAQIPAAILSSYKTLDSAEKRDAVNTLLARPASARALIAAIEAKALDRAEITAPAARQLQSLRDPEIDAWMAKHWGAVRGSSADRQREIAKFKEFCTTDLILRADAERGRAIFTQTCAACHTLHGSGAKIGPELPGGFEDLDYLLQNIVDPNAIIGKDYQQTFVQTKDGQTVSGVVQADDASAVTLKTLAGSVTVQRADIASIEVSPNSLMPEGLLSTMDEESVRDLFLYLRQKQQVPMLVTAGNAADFFNGADLSRWHASADGEWKVENGELVGRSDGARTAVLISDMVAGDYRWSAKIKAPAGKAAVEIAFGGRSEAADFRGCSLSLGGEAPPSFWAYVGGKPLHRAGNLKVAPGEWTLCEIEAKGPQFTVSLNGKVAFRHTDLPRPGRNGFAFYLAGKDAEFRVKDMRIETAVK